MARPVYAIMMSANKSAHRDVQHKMVKKRCLVGAFLSCNSTYGSSFMVKTHPKLKSFKKIYTDGWETKSKKEATLFLNIFI